MLPTSRTECGVTALLAPVLCKACTNRPGLASAFDGQSRLDARTILEALAAGTDPGGSGIVVL
jgi:hypothetical protein